VGSGKKYFDRARAKISIESTKEEFQRLLKYDKEKGPAEMERLGCNNLPDWWEKAEQQMEKKV